MPRDSQAEAYDRSADSDEREGHAEASGRPKDDLNRLRAERDEAVAARQRALADFVNYQRRAQENEIAARRDAVRGIVRSLLPVLDHFDLALQNAERQITVEQLLAGVQMVRDELNKALGSHGMHLIEPKVGEEFDPRLHQAVLHEPSGDLEPGRIANVLQIGCEVDDVVLRPASVAIASAPQER